MIGRKSLGRTSPETRRKNPKVEIHDLLRKHFTNGIWKFYPSLRFRDLVSFCDFHTSALSKDNNVCTLGMFQ